MAAPCLLTLQSRSIRICCCIIADAAQSTRPAPTQPVAEHAPVAHTRSRLTSSTVHPAVQSFPAQASPLLPRTRSDFTEGSEDEGQSETGDTTLDEVCHCACVVLVCFVLCVLCCVYVCTHACMCACLYVCLNVCVLECMYVCMYACMYVCRT